MVRIIDSFLYNGEPVVQFRLQLLAPFVDEFIITECKLTHSGKEKPFWWCEKNADVFAPYMHKITFVKIHEIPPVPQDWLAKSYSGFMKNADDWWRENYQRDIIAKKIEEAGLDEPFVLICTDADEIPSPTLFQSRETVEDTYLPLTEPVYLEMMFFYYNFNWIKPYPWYSGFIVTDKTYKLDTLSNLRCYRQKKYVALNAGWHCGYFLSISDLQRKVESFAHQEWNSDEYKNEKHIRRCLDNGLDFFLREGENMKRHDMTKLPPGWAAFQEEIEMMQMPTQI